MIKWIKEEIQNFYKERIMIQSKSMQEKEIREKQLKNILSQAERIIELSEIKTGREHPIFSFITAISRKVFYNNIFLLNSSLESLVHSNSYNQDLGWLQDTFPDQYTLLNPISISLVQDPVWSFPWEPTRHTNCLARIGSNVNEPFVFQANNHFSTLLLPLGLTMIHNGNHSTACGIIKGEGSIEVKEVVDISCNCHDFYFDGIYICRISDNSPVYEVKQFECGVLFELSRMICNSGINFLDGINVDRKVDIIKEKDKSWKIFFRKNRSILHYYINGSEGECEVDIFDHTIIFTTTAESFGMSTTNAAEDLATFVANEYNIPLEKVVCYEHYLSSYFGNKELINRIEFEVKEGRLCNPVFYSESVLPEKFRSKS